MRRAAALAAVAMLCGACAHAPLEGAHGPGTDADSVTIALWHLDETGGTHVADAGPFRLDAVAGLDTRTSFGRDRNGRVFGRALNSFLYVPWNPILEPGGGLTIEAWVMPASYSQYEDSPIAARWTPNANEQSWLFSITGRRLPRVDAPTFHQALLQGGSTGVLMFAYEPEIAGPAQVFYSSRPVALGRWTHVAATFDGQVVRFYLDGLLDSQYASVGRIRHSETGLLVGNFFDPRGLTQFGGELRTAGSLDPGFSYAFDGMIDELRLSSTARSRYPGIGR